MVFFGVAGGFGSQWREPEGGGQRPIAVRCQGKPTERGLALFSLNEVLSLLKREVPRIKDLPCQATPSP
jgi:hypothetical protein